MKKVVVLGGGIAGVEAAIACRKAGFQVELISDRDYLFVYPISIWVPVSTLSFDDAKVSLRAVSEAHEFTLTLDRVCAIDASRREFSLEQGGIRQEEAVVIALGAGKAQIPGQEHTLSICGDPEQSLRLKARIDDLVEKGCGQIAFGFGGNPNDPSAVRGGPAFELFFNLHHRLRQLGIRDRFELTFFAPMAEPGARMGAKALRMMDARFKADGLRTHYGTRIKEFQDHAVVFEDGSVLPTDLTMFIAAGRGCRLILSSDLPQNAAGFIRIGPTCEVDGVPGWYAIGDAAALEGPEWKAKQGHVAEAMAKIAAHNLAIDRLGGRGRKRTYGKHLNILCLMDMGNGGGLVYRDAAKAFLIPMPIVGHWLKRLWGHYYKASKLGRMPRIPGL